MLCCCYGDRRVTRGRPHWPVMTAPCLSLSASLCGCSDSACTFSLDTHNKHRVNITRRSKTHMHNYQNIVCFIYIGVQRFQSCYDKDLFQLKHIFLHLSQINVKLNDKFVAVEVA